MNTCYDIEILLTEYAAGELDASASARVTRHLENCAGCRHEAGREAVLRETLGGLPVQACPDRIGRRLAERDKSRRRRPDLRTVRPGWPGALGLVAAAVLAIVLLPGLLSQPDSEPGTAVPARQWTSQEIAAAREDMLYTLALTAEVLDRSSKSTMADVFGDRIPQAVTGSFKVKTTTRGGKG